MIEETAVVVELQGDQAVIEVTRQSSCGQCAAQKGCGTTVFAGWFGARLNRMQVANAINAGIGDRVVVGLDESSLFKASLLVYLLPLLLMAAFGLVAQWLVPVTAYSDVIVILFALGGFITALFINGSVQHRFKNNPAYHPVLLRQQPPVARVIPVISVTKEF